jgi:hypothetical protein
VSASNPVHDSQLIQRHSTAQGRSSVLTLELKHRSAFALSKNLLGSLHAEIGDLLGKCQGDKGEYVTHLHQLVLITRSKKPSWILLRQIVSTVPKALLASRSYYLS